ncbi:hypothetical protein RHSIM_Rhsim04G0150700 [Rhododendron simsii]|uniref:CCHC-type domain-containing protein n=1 Tax=Rhododendron simsii TaxID=118357 RepID=A0A834H7X1_RHOSS|nr:hypothetical protein RHSIM_Rhsim04G0150700 [Rhododendron simsii]
MAEFEILDLEEGSGETGVSNSQCLVGKVIQSKVLNATIITNILAAAWKTRAPYHVSDWNNNVFLFRFEDPEDKRLVMQNGPWSIMNSLLVLRPLESNMVVSEINFQHCPFWVQIHGLPVEKMCRANAEIIGKRFGKLIAIEAAPSNMLLSRSFLQVKVEINISQPLPKGFMLRGKTGRDLWISYLYERLPDFCYACGQIGHDKRSCRFTSRDAEGQSGYGPELRTGRARKIDVPIEEFSSQEGGAMDTAQNVLTRPPEVKGSDDIRVRLPELQRSAGDEAREDSVVAERVMSPWMRQDQQTSVGVGVPYATNDDVLSGTSVKSSTEPGNVPNSNPLGGALRISEFVSSGSSVLLSDCGPDPVLKSILTAHLLTPEPKVSPSQSTSQSFHTSPAYFVTEPPDSPRALQPNSLNTSNPNSTSQISQAIITPSQIHPSTIVEQGKPALSKIVDISLASVFKTLNLKRKAQEDPPELNNSKILRLCSPTPPPSTSIRKLPVRNRKPIRNPRSLKPLSKGNDSLSDNTMLEEGLVEIPVVQLQNSPGAVTSLVPGTPKEVVLEPQRHWAYFDKPGVGFDDSSYVEPEGLSGGLALWWTKDVEPPFSMVAPYSQEEILFGIVLKALLDQKDCHGCVWEISINECGLVDLEFKGPKFTWRNNRRGDDFIMERIDMAFANAKWRELHEQAMVFVEAAIESDHNPLLLNTVEALNKVGKPFKFESFWVTEEDCKEVVSEVWCQSNDGSKMYTVCKKLRGCKEKLKQWSFKKFGNLRLKIVVTKDQLAEVQKQIESGFNEDYVALEKILVRKLEDLWQKDSMYWHQRSRIKWLRMGDKNSRFFHLSTIQRRQRNQVMRLKDSSGVWRTDQKEIAEIIKGHFQELYKSPPSRDFGDLISLVEPVILEDWNAKLTREVTKEEVQLAAFQYVQLPLVEAFDKVTLYHHICFYL